VTSTEGYVVALAVERGAGYLIRGVRGASDIDSEIAVAQANVQLAPEVETLFVRAEQRLSAVSSSELKRRVSAGGNVASYCTPVGAAALRAALGYDVQPAECL
jgi:pantetheine-phosphate adenylyltransferase